MVKSLEDKKAENIKILDLREVSLIADYFIIATGNSSTQVKAICENVEKEVGEPPLRREGFNDANWVLLDYNAVVVHVFQEELREFYNLERLWGNAKEVFI